MEDFKKLLINPTFQRICLVGIIIIILLLLFNTHKELNRNSRIYLQNEKALRDSTIIWKDKFNVEYSENFVLLQTTDSLSDWSKKLQGKIDSLKMVRPGTEIISASQSNISISGLSGSSTNTQMTYENGIGKFSWFFDKKEDGLERYLSGETNYQININGKNINIVPGKTLITKDNYNIEIFMYTTLNKDNSISVIASSPSKNVSIKQVKQVIDPIVIEKFVDKYIPSSNKDVEINWGLQAGVGVNPFRTTDPISSQFAPIVYVGIGIQYELGNILEFNFSDLNPF